MRGSIIAPVSFVSLLVGVVFSLNVGFTNTPASPVPCLTVVLLLGAGLTAAGFLGATLGKVVGYAADTLELKNNATPSGL